MKKLGLFWRESSVNRWFIFLFGLIWLIGGVIALSLPSNGVLQTAEAAPSMITPTVLHFQGNTEEGCTGNGMADFTACNGPFLRPDSALSAGAAAHWDPPGGLVTNSDRQANHTDPNWIWNLSGPTRLGGPMTIEWWASCGACGAGLPADWMIRIWADGVKKFEQRVTAPPDAPNIPKLLTTTVLLRENFPSAPAGDPVAITANTKIVLHIDPVYIDAQQNTHIYYDSQLPCTSSTAGACDSKVTMPVLDANEPVPTPTPGNNDIPPPSACQVPTYDNYQPPAEISPGVPYPRRDQSGEPSIGVNWNTGNVMAMSRLRPNRATFNDSTSPADPVTGTTWFSKPINTLVTGLDPILFTDSVTGRTIAGELQGAGGATNGIISDDDLTSSVATFQTGGPSQGVDHQSIGGGPPKQGILGRQPVTSYPHLFYYASQQIGYASVATSFDGGLTYEPAVPAYTIAQCGGIHGHIKVAPDGTVYFPNKNCGGKAAVVVSEDNGLTWQIRTVPTSSSIGGISDPSVGIGAGGRLYLSYTSSDRQLRVAVSEDKGLTWRDDFNLGKAAEHVITAGLFPAVVAGDNNRAAVFFLGTGTTNPGDPFGSVPTVKATWFPYIATTCDGGKSWSVVRADNDPLHPGVPNPLQQGPICTSGTACPAPPAVPANTRNLLDFNDITVDSRGRILVVYADGCNFDHPCINITDNTGDTSSNQGVARLTIIRQRSGMRLFGAFDPAGPTAPPLPPPISVEETKMGNKIKWTMPDDGGSPLTAYRIYRSRAGGGVETLIAEVKPGMVSYVDRKTRRAKGVSYRVAAVNKYGETLRGGKTSAGSRGE
ncbi:MAG: hypothetical protein M3209_10865 [Acidobacteriota bacterium]|nr:hypothetical protein [Acidobacteriota bacterium]